MACNIDRDHAAVGLTLDELRGWNLGTFYPVLDDNLFRIIGVFSAEFGTPEGYQLDEELQAYVKWEPQITWTASNGSSFLSNRRKAKTMRSAVTAAKRYVHYVRGEYGELYGEVEITIYADGAPVRTLERSLQTRMRWVSNTL